MKNLIILGLVIVLSTTAYSQVGIGTTTPDPSAKLEVNSTERGFLPPRMTTGDRDGIVNPVEGLVIYNTDKNCIELYSGLGWRNLCAVVAEGDVINSATGQIWMDRNLGASQVATSSMDSDAYGDLFQWGRFADGHQYRNSATTSTLSGTDQPGHGDFILAPSSPFDWRSPQNDNLWQGVNGVNNPCPSGYRLPTETELNAERLSWGSNNAAGAFASPLKLPMAGYRNGSTGLFSNVGTLGAYWSSTVSSAGSRSLNFNSNTDIFTDLRADGNSVRCLKD